MPDARRDLMAAAARAADVIGERRRDPVAPHIDEEALAARLQGYDFARPRALEDVVADLSDMLRRYAVRSDHPRYFGLFNPPALVPAIAGDLIAAAVNPQLAVWSHAPAAAEIESKLVQLFASFVWPKLEAAGTFTSGGSEANFTALLAALAHRLPHWRDRGLPREGPRLSIYASAESHLAWIKLARMCGLGGDAVRLVSADDGLSLSGQALARAIDADADRVPLLVVATAGTTGHGSIDDLAGIAEAGRARGAHVHVDAAWAGGTLLHGTYRALLAGIEMADSVTIDPHKWLSVPMGAGLYLAREWRPLQDAFDVRTSYMPSASTERRDAYIHSIQWSRRFIGAKLFTALATLGLDGYQAVLDRTFVLADRLRTRLVADGWTILNRTALPLVCFTHAGLDDDALRSIERRVAESGEAWISTVTLRGRLALRACITSFETTEADVDALGDALAATLEMVAA